MIVVASCSESALLAPVGASIVASVSPSTIAVGGDTAVLSVLVREADGSHVDDGTQVEVVATNAQVCAFGDTVSIANSCTQWRGIQTLTTHNGVATAAIRSADAAGSIALDIRSGTATASVTLTASGRVVPDKGKLLLQAERDTAAVGQNDQMLVFASDSAGGTVPDGTRIVFSVDGQHHLSRLIALTHDGFATTTFNGAAAGDATVTASSGTVKARTTIVVRP